MAKLLLGAVSWMQYVTYRSLLKNKCLSLLMISVTLKVGDGPL